MLDSIRFPVDCENTFGEPSKSPPLWNLLYPIWETFCPRPILQSPEILVDRDIDTESFRMFTKFEGQKRMHFIKTIKERCYMQLEMLPMHHYGKKNDSTKLCLSSWFAFTNKNVFRNKSSRWNKSLLCSCLSKFMLGDLIRRLFLCGALLQTIALRENIYLGRPFRI